MSVPPKGLHFACEVCKPYLLKRKGILMKVTFGCAYLGQCTECGKEAELLTEITDEGRQ